MENTTIDSNKVCGILNEIMEYELAGVVRYTHSSMMVSGPYRLPIVSFRKEQAAESLLHAQQAGEKIEFGDDLLDSHLRVIGNNHPGFYFLTDWPMKLKPFYIREKDEDATLSRSFDLQYGYLELSSGGTRLHDSELLKARLSRIILKICIILKVL